MKNEKIYLKVSDEDPDVAYLYLPNHPKNGGIMPFNKQLRLHDLIENYKGPDIYIDLDEEGNAIGLEILV